MQPKKYFHLLSSQVLLSVIQAWPHDNYVSALPRETQYAEHYLVDRAPAPALEPTSPPKRHRNELVKRDSATCGYIEGDPSNMIRCSSTAYCFSDPYYSILDCCAETFSSDCTARTTCYDMTDSESWSSESETTAAKLCSSRDRALCATFYWVTGEHSGYTFYGCRPTRDGFSIAYDDPTTISSSDEPSSAVSSTTKPSSSNPVSTSISTIPLTPATPTPTTTSSAEPSGGVPVGAIAGGVIGGLGLIALVSFGLFFFCFRHKKRATTGAVDYSGGSHPPQPVVQSQPFATNNDVALSSSPAFGGPNTQEAKLTYNTGSRLSTTSPVPPYTPQMQQQQQQYIYTPPPGELDTRRGDGQLRELA